jgi:hypothetical protein
MTFSAGTSWSIPRLPLLLGLLFFSGLSLVALPTYHASSPEVQELRSLYAASGLIFPTETYPIGREELARYAARLADAASHAGLRDRVRLWQRRFAFLEGRSTIASDMSISLWAGARSEAVPWDADFDYQYDYIQAPPLYGWTLSADKDGSGGIAISAEIRSMYEKGAFPENSLFRPRESNPVTVENYFITSGYFYKRFDDVSLLLGRSPVHFGSAAFSTGLPADHLPYLDGLRLTWELGPLKMTGYAASLENRFKAGGMEMSKLAEAEWNTGDPVIINTDGTFANGTDLAFGSTNIFLALHRFEWAFRRGRLAVSALQIVCRENNSIHIGDFFPVFSWHQAELGAHNLSLLVEASAVPLPGLELFAQAGWDDIDSSTMGIPDYDIPTIPFYLAGAAWGGEFFDRPASLSLEAGSSHYLWGNFHEYKEGDGENYLSRAIYRHKRDTDYVLIPLTSPYGPGVTWLAGAASFGVTSSFQIDGKAELRWRNALADMVTTAYAASAVVEDAPRYGDHRFALSFRWSRPAPEAGATEKQMSGTFWHPSFFTEAALLVRDGKTALQGTLGGSIGMINKSVRRNLNDDTE